MENKIAALEKEKKQLITQEKLKDYIDRITPIYDQWRKIKQNEGNVHKLGSEKKFDSEKFALVSSFVQIASDYSPLNLSFKPLAKDDICPYCRKPYSSDEENKIICYTCVIFEDKLNNTNSYNIGRVNGSNTIGYINRENFMKAINNYQGKHECMFPDKIFIDMEKYCEQNKVNKCNLTYEKTRQIFKILGYSDFYDQIYLFLFMFSEKPLPNISMYESQILQDYDLFFQKFNIIKGDERDSGLNAQYLLFILLKRRGIKSNKDIGEFKIPDTRNILLDSENIARRVFQELGWTFEDTI